MLQMRIYLPRYDPSSPSRPQLCIQVREQQRDTEGLRRPLDMHSSVPIAEGTNSSKVRRSSRNDPATQKPPNSSLQVLST